MPANIEEILNSKAPFLLKDQKDHQRIRDSHLLTLIPGRINGETFTLDKLGELILSYFPRNNENRVGFHAHGYRYYNTRLTHQQYREALSETAYWLLLPKTILANSRGKTFSDHQAMVAPYSRLGYRLPHALEVATSLMAHYARSKERLYANQNSKDWWTYTHCMDVDKDGNPIMVGKFEPSGLYIYDYHSFDNRSGVSCCWKL